MFIIAFVVPFNLTRVGLGDPGVAGKNATIAGNASTTPAPVSGLTLANGGTGYNTASNVSVQNYGPVVSLTIDAIGTGYTTQPKVATTGGSGHELILSTTADGTGAITVRTSIVVDHYHQPRPVPYRRYASTLTYGRALMGRASRENISCRGLRWDIFPLRSDYGSTSMAWVGLLKWAIYIWHSLLQV